MKKQLISTFPILLIYLSPNGSDGNIGASPSTAVATLQHALSLASVAPQGTEVRIIAEPTIFPPGNGSISNFTGAPIRIIGSWWPGAAADAKPTFSCATGESLLLTVSRTDIPALYTGVSLEDVVVADCPDGVEFRGNMGNPMNFIWGNELYNVDFKNIGTATDGIEAVGVFNAWSTKLYNLTFSNIKNGANPSAMHAIYLGHHSRDTWVGGETYTGVSGAAIAIRNDVQRTLIWNQAFGTDVANPKIIDWYCRVSDEPCPTLNDSTAPECPSWGTYIESATGLKDSDVLVYDGNTPYVASQYVNGGKWNYPSGCLVPERIAIGSLQ